MSYDIGKFLRETFGMRILQQSNVPINNRVGNGNSMEIIAEKHA